MKTIKRILLGIASSLLLSVGLARAAQQLDPLTQSLGHKIEVCADATPGLGCVSPCETDVS